MILKTYIITSDTAGGEIILKYNVLGHLIGMEITAELTEDQYKRFEEKFPFRETHADAMTKVKNSKVKLIPEDLSFENFWNAYGYKEGKKKVAENSWKKLSKKEKVNALAYIPNYNRKLQISGIAKAYPSTYLNNEYWQNG